MNEIKLDNTLTTSKERTIYVKNLIDDTPSDQLTPYILESLTTYILQVDEKTQKHAPNNILTKNRQTYTNDRETSFEGLVDKFNDSENGNKDNIYNFIANDKNIIFSPKAPITEEDIKEVPGLSDVINAIKETEKRILSAVGKKKSILVQQLINLRKDQYVLRNNYRQPIKCNSCIKSISKIDLSEKITINAAGEIVSNGILSLINPDHVSMILCNYARLKEESYEDLQSDCRWMLLDLENLADAALKEKYPLYYKLMIYKIDGKTNLEIQSLLYEEFGIKNTIEYISSLWRNKIPKLIAEEAQNEWLIWHYTYEEKGKWKRCSRCGQIKLADNRFFSKNSTSKDGYYSICKTCRNTKRKEG